MTPDKYELLIDQFDATLETAAAAGQTAVTPEETGNGAESVTDPESVREFTLLRLAVEAIRHNAITDEVAAIRNRYQASRAKAQAGDTTTDTATAAADATIATVDATTTTTDARAAGADTIPMYPVEQAPASIVRKMTAYSMRIAAVLVLAVSLTGLGKYLFTSPSGIYEKYYTPYELSATRGSESQGTLERAYQDKNWMAVVAAFNTTHAKTGKDYFLTGMAYMEQKEYYEAIGLFTMLLHDNEQAKTASFQDEAQYYLAMSYLATHQAAPALVLFDKIKADPNHLFNRAVKNMSSPDMMILRAK